VDPSRATPPRRLLRGGDDLAGLVGRRVLVGLSYTDEAGEPLSSIQFCGRVLEVTDGVVVVANPEGAAPVALPADPDAFLPADPGRYVLRHSGEVVVDPDYLTGWTVVLGPDGEQPAQAVPGPGPGTNPASPSATATTS
jgi:hypothetical protein